jgi:hypothetical protein
VSSTRGSIALKAQENFQITSGNTETGGILTLENRSTGSPLTEIETEALQNGSAIGSGIQLKSVDSGVSILGNYLFAGGYAVGSGSSKQGFNSQATSCDIYIDSGGGDVLLTGSRGAMLFADALSMSMGKTPTGIYMDSSNIAYVANSKNIFASPDVVVDKGTGSVTKPEMTASGIRERSARLPTTVPKLTIQGELDVKEGISTKGTILSGGEVRAAQGCNEEPLSSGPSISIDNTSSPDVLSAVEDATEGMVNVMQTSIDQGLSTEYGMKAPGFAFPDGASDVYRSKNFELVVSGWQDLVNTKDTWEEKPLTHDILDNDTYPYPGREIFKDKKEVLKSFNLKTNEIQTESLDKYKINLTPRT